MFPSGPVQFGRLGMVVIQMICRTWADYDILGVSTGVGPIRHAIECNSIEKMVEITSTS
jgi:hypothetical protein